MTSTACPSQAEADIQWNTENPLPEPGPTCCQCGCTDAPKATPEPATPVWNVHLKDGRVAKVRAIHFTQAGDFLNAIDQESVPPFSNAAFPSKDIDFIARDGAVEIAAKPTVQPGGGECFENYCLRNNVNPECGFAHQAWIAERKKTAPKQESLPTVEDVQRIYREVQPS